MKKHFLITLVLMVFALVATAQNKKIAILETVDKEGNVPYGIRLQLRSNLTYAISNTPGYEGFDRVDMAQIMGEQDFQRSGMVSDEQIRKLGEMTGCSSILVAEAAIYDNDNIIITAKILNVETASVERSVPPHISNINPEKMQKACIELADKLLVKTLDVIEKPEEKLMVEKSLITKGKDFYYIDGQRLTDNQYVELIKNCPEAWVNYKKGKILKTTGWVVLGLGAGLALGVGMLEANNIYGDPVITYTILGVHVITSPILIFIGRSKKKNAYKIYNQYCAQPQAKLSLGPATNSIGLGVYLNF